jgi:hypothetical protein
MSCLYLSRCSEQRVGVHREKNAEKIQALHRENVIKELEYEKT